MENYIPNYHDPFEEYKKQMKEMREAAREQIEKLNQDSIFEDGESFIDYIEQIDKNIKNSIFPLQEFSESAKSQAESAKTIADSASRQADSAVIIAEKANSQSASAKKKVNWSLLLTFVSCIGTLIANADKIYVNVIKILYYLGVLK